MVWQGLVWFGEFQDYALSDRGDGHYVARRNESRNLRLGSLQWRTTPRPLETRLYVGGGEILVRETIQIHKIAGSVSTFTQTHTTNPYPGPVIVGICLSCPMIISGPSRRPRG